MYSFTKNLPEKQNKILVYCDCTRTFIAEEMYCCLNCSQVFCRFCTTNEIYCYYCKQCGETVFPQDMVSIKTQCNSCLECPCCRHVLTLTIDASQNQFFFCQYCSWSSKQINVVDQKMDVLYTKLHNELRKVIEPMHQEFIRNLTKLKEIETEVKNKKLVNKIKKVFNRSYTQPKVKNLTKFSFLDAEQQQIDNHVKVLQMRYNLELSQNQINLLNAKESDAPKCHIFGRTSQSCEKDLLDFQELQYNKILGIDQIIRQQSILPVNDPKTMIPSPVNLLTKKNRKCRKCSSLIIKIEKLKDNKFVHNITSYLCENCPSLMVTRVKDSGDVMVTFMNKTRQNLQMQLSALPERILNVASQCDELPREQLTLPALEIDMTAQEEQLAAQKNTLLFPLDQGTQKFGFILEVQIENETESKQLSYPMIIQLAKQ